MSSNLEISSTNLTHDVKRQFTLLVIKGCYTVENQLSNSGEKNVKITLCNKTAIFKKKCCFSVASGEDLVPEPENEVEEL